jgi:hypothetical protein
MRQSRECAVDLLPDKAETRDNSIAQGAEQIDRDYFHSVCLLPVPNGWVLLLQKTTCLWQARRPTLPLPPANGSQSALRHTGYDELLCGTHRRGAGSANICSAVVRAQT